MNPASYEISVKSNKAGNQLSCFQQNGRLWTFFLSIFIFSPSLTIINQQFFFPPALFISYIEFINFVFGGERNTFSPNAFCFKLRNMIINVRINNQHFRCRLTVLHVHSDVQYLINLTIKCAALH